MALLEAFYCGENIRPVLLDFSGIAPSQSSVARASEMAYTQMHKSINRFYAWGYAQKLKEKDYSKEDLLQSETPVYDEKKKASVEFSTLWNLAKERASACATDDAARLVFGETMYDMLALEASSHPVNCLKILGTSAGMLYPPDQMHPNKRFVLSQDILEMILRSTVSPDEVLSGNDMRNRLWERFGIIIGGSISTDVEKSEYTLTPSIEKAVLWRSVPEYAGNIVVFVKTDTDKLHSLAEFDVISLRDVSKYLLELQISNESNAPTQNFWRALQQTSDYYSFEAIMEFVQSISNEETVAEAIPNNMWRLNLLCDADILGTKYKPSDRLTRNRELIFAIGQLSEDSRKKLSRSLAKTEGDDRIRLQNAYNLLQNLYKYGKRDILKQLDFATVQELFSASKANESKKKKKSSVKNSDGTESDTPNVTSEAAPIRPKELGQLISDAIVNGDENDAASIKELLEELKKHFDPETEENNDSIPTIGGVFDDRTMNLFIEESVTLTSRGFL